MTTIVWDGEVLAADTQVTQASGNKVPVTKLFRIKNGIIGAIYGSLPSVYKIQRWVEKNHTKAFKKKDITGYPDEFNSEGEEVGSVIVIDGTNKGLNGKPVIYEYTQYGPDPITYLDTSEYAWGSGASYARGYMYAMKWSNLSFSSVAAVEVASLFDAYTGNIIQQMKPWE